MTNTAKMATRRTTSTTGRRETAAARPDAPRPPRYRRSGWVVTAVVALAIVTVGVVASIGPYQDYVDASARLAEQQAQVSVLEQENQSLQAEVQRLQRPSYVEALARKDLNKGRPGEEIFVVEGIPSTGVQTADEEPEVQQGPLERLVERLRSLW